MLFRKDTGTANTHTVDTDVVILVIARFNQIKALNCGTKSNFCYIPIREILSGMDPGSSASFPRIHKISAFGGRGKKTA